MTDATYSIQKNIKRQQADLSNVSIHQEHQNSSSNLIL